MLGFYGSLCSRCVGLLLCSGILNSWSRHLCGFPVSRRGSPPFPSFLYSLVDNRIQDRVCSSCSAGPWKAHMNMSKLAGSSWSKKKTFSLHEWYWHDAFPGLYKHFWKHENARLTLLCSLFMILANWYSFSPLPGVPGKRRYKRREVEQIQKDVRRMRSLNFEHVQKILRAKRLQRQAKTGNNVIKRRPGRPRKQPIEELEMSNRPEEDRVETRGLDMLSSRRGDGRTLGMPVLERCDDSPGRLSLRPGLAPDSLEYSNHDSISATIETVVHQARSVPSLAKGGKRRGRGNSRDELWSPSSQ